MSRTISSTYTSGIILSGGDNPVTITGTALVGNTDASGYAVSGPTGTNWTLTNSGQISETASGGTGIGFADAGTITNATGGTIAAAGYGVVLAGGGGVSNASGGTISGYIGVRVAGAAGTVVNAGLIAGVSASSVGIYLAAGGTITNQAGGTITGVADAVKFKAGFANRLVDGPGAVFTGTVDGGNTLGSTIVSTLELASGASSGTLSELGTQFINFKQVTVDAGATWTLSGTASGFATLTNAGTLQSGVLLGSAVAVSNQSGGTITGASGISDPTAALTVINAGSIGATGIATGSAGVALRSGGAVTNQSGGTITGLNGVYGKTLAATVVNAGSIGGDAGYGMGVYLQAGGALTNQSGGTISGFTAVNGVVAALTVVNAGFIGQSTISGSSRGLVLDAGGQVSNQSGGLISAQYAVRLNGTGVTLANAGTIHGGTANGPGLNAGSAVSISSAGLVTNQSGGLITAQVGVFVQSTAATVMNAGSIAGDPTATPGAGVFIGSGGRVTNQSGGTITGFSGVYSYNGEYGAPDPSTIVNLGRISGNATAGSGIQLNAGGIVSNQAGGVITGLRGVYATTDALTVVNAGSIGGSGTSGSGVSLAAGGSVSNQAGGAISGLVGVYASNAAPIVVANAGSIGGGIVLAGGGTISNTGTGVIAASGSAIAVGNYAGTVINDATITGGTGVSFTGAFNQTLIDSGTIIGSAGSAVVFGSGDDLLQLLPGSLSIQGTVDGGAGSNTMALGSAGSTGTLSGLGTQFINFRQVSLDAGANWSLSGSNTIVAGETLTLTGATLGNSGTLVDDGVIQVGSGTLSVGSLLGTGQATIGAAGTLSVSGTVASGATIAFAGTSGVLALGTPSAMAGTIAGIVAGDTIELLGISNVTGTDLVNGNTLHVSLGSGGPIDLLLSGDLTGDVFHFNNTGGNSFITEDTTPCFLFGTPIRTDRGDVAVQDLRIGDRVVTLSGAAEPIKWIGRRSYASAFAAGNSDVIPIEIQAGALADKVPDRDLIVSPLHAMYLDGVLVPAKALVNGVTIRIRNDIDPIRYFHLELEQHSVIFAAGAPTETYVDADNRGMFHNAPEFAALYPDAATAGWIYCAPRVEGGPALQPIRAALAARAGIAGSDPAVPCGELLGQIDDANLTILNGWAYDGARPGLPVRLEIWLDDGIIAEVTADRHLAFLQAQGYGDGRHGFAVWLPAGLSPHARHVVRVRRKDDGAELAGSPRVLQPVSRQSLLNGEALLPAVEAAVHAASDPAALDGLRRALQASADRVRQITALRADKPRAGTAGLLAWGDRTRSRRALVIDERLPRPTRTAGTQAVVSHMAALQALGWEVEFIAAREVACDENLAGSLESQGIRVHRAPEIATVEELLRRRQDAFQLVYLHRLASAEAYGGLSRAYQRHARLIYSVGALQHIRVARQARAQSSLALSIEARSLQQREIAAMRMADAVITASPWEAAYLAGKPASLRVHLVPPGVTPCGHETTTPARRGVALIGSYRDAAVVDAARWLADSIMPLVWQSRPDTECFCIGADWPETLPWLTDKRIRRLGPAEDPGAAYEIVRATVAPLRFAAGVAERVLDSFAAGVPCIMTPFAAEGLGLPSRLQAWVGEAAAELASLIVRADVDFAFSRAGEAAAIGHVRAAFSPAAAACAMAAAVTQRLAPPGFAGMSL